MLSYLNVAISPIRFLPPHLLCCIVEAEPLDLSGIALSSIRVLIPMSKSPFEDRYDDPTPG